VEGRAGCKPRALPEWQAMVSGQGARKTASGLRAAPHL